MSAALTLSEPKLPELHAQLISADIWHSTACARTVSWVRARQQVIHCSAIMICNAIHHFLRGMGKLKLT